MRQILGLEGLILGCKVVKSCYVKNIKKPKENQRFWEVRGSKMGPSGAQHEPKLGQVGLKLASEGDLDVILPSWAHLGGNMADKMATHAA